MASNAFFSATGGVGVSLGAIKNMTTDEEYAPFVSNQEFMDKSGDKEALREKLLAQEEQMKKQREEQAIAEFKEQGKVFG